MRLNTGMARGLLGAVLASATILGVGQVSASANSAAISLPKSPISASTLVAQAVHSGAIHFAGGKAVSGSGSPQACTPPCALANVDVKPSSNPVNETPVAANPVNSSQLLTGANDYNCNNIQGFYTSGDGGATWPNQTCLSSLPGFFGDGDPVVGYDTTGKAYIGGLQGSGNPSTVAIETSTNNGSSWSAPSASVKEQPGYSFVDKDWLAVNDFAKTKEVNDLAICTTQFTNSNNSAITVATSENAKKWKTVIVDKQNFPTIDQFCDLNWQSSGTLDLSWMECSSTGPTGDCGGTTAKEMFSSSSNDGKTWSAPVTISSVNLAPDSCGAYYGCLPNTNERVSNIPSIGSSGNNIYAAFYNWTGAFMQVEVAASTNGGSSFGTPVPVRPADVHDQFFPWLSVDQSNGAVDVTWDDRFNDPNNVNYTYTYAQSTNGGLTFSPASDLATVASNPFNDGFGGGFIGDYTGNTVSAPNITNAVWTDTRTGIDNEFSGGYDQ